MPMGESVAMENRKSERSFKRKPAILDFYARQGPARRTASNMWETENDPFQVFEVEHESCLDLEIVVKNGENITKGSVYQDICDTPDPYVVLRIPGSSNSSKRTSHVDNTVNPIWNETFHFFLDPKCEHTLNVILMDANYIMSDEILGTNSIEVSKLPPEEPKEFIVEFPGGSKVHITLTLGQNKTPDLRFSLALCEEEKNFLRTRRQKVLNNMRKLLGDKGPKSKEEVPIVAVLGSGGGYRAMICLSGVVKALHESGILGCSTYISGLSGSSWLISTMYAHDKFPNITYEEFYDELRASVTQNWKWNLLHFHSYVVEMMTKYRKGQPVSFTDIFGHLLGDVLLKGQKHKKLSDQRKIVSEGLVPLPLYTCLHAKAAVSCRSFSEWIEFSPFEIGIAKYGTYMKTEHFGSKFLVGKLIKQYPEFPLHYLQGVWGSAFTILMKRMVFEGGRKQDIVQMMREVNEERAINEKLEGDYTEGYSSGQSQEKDSDTDDEADVDGADDKLSEDENKEMEIVNMNNDLKELKIMLEKEKNNFPPVPQTPEKLKSQKSLGLGRKSVSYDDADHSSAQNLSKTEIKKDKFNFKKFSFDLHGMGSFDFPKKPHKDEQNPRKISTQSDPGTDFRQMTSLAVKKNRIQRQGAIRERSKSPNNKPSSSNYWQNKRNDRKSARKPSVLQTLMRNSSVLNSRAGRAGEILNPFRGLSLRTSFPLSPFTAAMKSEEEEEDEGDGTDIGLGCRFESLDNQAKKLFIVDSGLAFNSPFPLLVRPQRAVDIYLSFDFSQRPKDNAMPFKELILAEKWARQNEVPFPPIEEQVAEFSKDKGVKELYVFKDPTNPHCPVILHFVIVNNKFKWEKAPGVRRVTKEELDFADFKLFDDPAQPFASTNFVYEHQNFERLRKLMEYNTLLCIDKIKEEFADMVEKKRNISEQVPVEKLRKMQNVLRACNKFKNNNDLRIRVNEAQGRRFIQSWSNSNALSKQHSINCDDISNFHDAYENLTNCDEESEDENSDYEETTDGV